MLHSIIAMPGKRTECSSLDEESFLDKIFQIITFHAAFMFFMPENSSLKISKWKTWCSVLDEGSGSFSMPYRQELSCWWSTLKRVE
jgi:hypothetical protein